MKRIHIPAFVAALTLLLDQGSKIYIKLNFYENQIEPVFGNWFRLYFVENEGMAFGWIFPGDYGKLALTLFRVAAVIFIGFYLKGLVDKKAPKGLIVSISLILAGAIGNIIDSIFYGVIFSDSYGRIAELFPPEGGYAPFFHGKVVDMMSVHLFRIDHVPNWIPVLGGKPFIFFGPIWNIADAAITIGVGMIILFQGRYFQDIDEDEEEKNETDTAETEQATVIPPGVINTDSAPSMG